MNIKKVFWIGAILLAVLVAVAVIVQNRKTDSGGSEGEEEKAKISHYTCPMHPQIHEDHPGECPICHMKLVPVYEETSPAPPEGGHPLLNKERVGERSVTISPERQQLIGVTTAPAEKKLVQREIRTIGRVAFDPDLAIAQREFVEISRNVPSLKDAAVQRLRLLGMSEAEIRTLGKKGRPGSNLYLPADGESVWVYASLYEYEFPFVKTGAPVLLHGPALPDGLHGVVRAIDPVVDPTTRSVRARIEVEGAGGKVKPESYLNVSIQVSLGEQVVVPKSAVIDTGTRQLVFVVHDGNHFQAREVKLGPEAGEERVIQSGINAGEIVVTSAAFLIDSESQLKAAVAGMEGHQH